jgi:hypothetical protein
VAMRGGGPPQHPTAAAVPVEPGPAPVAAVSAPATAPAPAAPAPPPAAAPAPAAPAPIARPGQPATVKVTIDSRPPGATVAIGGEVRGTTPFEGEISRRDAEVEVKLTLAGYAPGIRKIVLDDKVVLSLELERVRRTAASPAPVAPAAPPTRPPPATQAAPARDPIGTKNPFEQLENKKGQP